MSFDALVTWQRTLIKTLLIGGALGGIIHFVSSCRNESQRRQTPVKTEQGIVDYKTIDNWGNTHIYVKTQSGMISVGDGRGILDRGDTVVMDLNEYNKSLIGRKSRKNSFHVS